MGESKSNKINNDFSQKSDWVRIISFGIIVTCIIMLFALLGLMAWRATKNNPEVYRVIVTTDAQFDSLKTITYMDYEQVDSLINAVKSYDEQLTQKYQYLVEQKEQDNQVFYWGSLIVGIVIAVLGWFGFQSFTTIEDKAKEEAVSVAKRTAWTKTQKFLKDEGKQLIKKVAKDNLQDDTVSKVKEQVVNELNTIIEKRIEQYIPSSKVDDLDRRMASLEKSVKPEIDKTVNEAMKVMFEKYRRPVKEDSKKKEEK